MSRSGTSIRVLCVDDDPEAADLTAEFLEREDDRFDAETATSAAAALDRLDEDVDGVVSDYDMPKTDGLDFLERVRADFPDLPFVLFTGKGSEAVASEAISAGVTDYLQRTSGTDQYALLANRLRNAVERYDAERQVEITRERFRKLLADSGDYVHVLEADGTISWVSPAVERVLGYEPDDLVGRDAFALIHPQDTRSTRAAFEDLVADRTGESTVEVRVRDATGDWRWLEVKARNLLEDHSIEGVVGNVRDVTDRKRRVRALDRERKRFSALFENFPEPTISYEYEGGEPVVEAVNDAFVETFGIGRDAATDRPVDDLIVPPERLDEAREIDNRVSEGEFVDEVLRREAADGPRYFKFRNIPIPTEDGADGFGVYIDIHDRKRHEQDLERQNERLDAFTTIVSHDLRNPLHVASQGLALAREDCESEHFGTVERALDRMETLIEDLLALARQGESVGDLEAVGLDEFATRCWANLETAGADLQVLADPVIRADPARLRQLLENLLGNAVEHGGSDVAIEIGQLSDGEGFYVADDGPGIPAGDREAVFEGGFTTRSEGTGFGLTIVAEIATAHGWDLDVTESPAGGARFEVSGVDRPE